MADAQHGLLGLAAAAEAAGFDALYLPDRHMRAETVAPSSFTLLGSIAARTSSIRIGTCATVMSLYNPMLVAEALAQVDLLSRGRLVFSGTLGYHDDYWRFAGVPARRRVRRFSEAMDVLVEAWTSDGPWTYEGECFTFRDVHLLPRPYQRPRPPVWVGGGVDAAVVRAARWGDAWVADPFPFDGASWERRVALFREAASARGHADPQVALIRQAIVAETRAEAERLCEQRYLPLLRFYFRRGLLVHHPDLRSEADLTVAAARQHLVMGTPEECLEAVHRFAAMGVDHLVLKLAGQAGTPVEAERRDLQLLGEQVLAQVARPHHGHGVGSVR